MSHIFFKYTHLHSFKESKVFLRGIHKTPLGDARLHVDFVFYDNYCITVGDIQCFRRGSGLEINHAVNGFYYSQYIHSLLIVVTYYLFKGAGKGGDHF